jgi:hypothetical protein
VKVPQEYVRGQRAPETYLEKYFGQLDDVNKAEHVQGKIGGPWGRFAPQLPQKGFLAKI